LSTGIDPQLIYSIISILCFVPAIIFHEVAHGFVAYKLGDPTAKSQGRLSLNPIRHVDPFGTVILPLVLAIGGGPVFGYAKPVPYNPGYFKDIRKGELLTGLAGPAANLALGVLGAVVSFVALQAYGLAPDIFFWIINICYMFTMVNFFLMFFNLIPIPPLDGSSIIALFLSDKALRQYYQVQRYALPVLMVLLIVVPYVLNVNPIGIYLNATAGNLANLLFPYLF
jgi:Zn-dependent protease